MSFIYSQALVAASLPASCWATDASAPLSGSPTPKPCLWHDKTMAPSRLSRFGMTCKLLTESLGEELLTLYLAAFPAKTSAQLEKEQALTESAAECGEKWRGSFTKYDPDTSLWRTHQCSLLGDLEPFSETWPKWGLMRNGECWEQQTLAHPTKETVFGFYVPTPTSSDGTSGAVIGKNDQFYPTRDGKPRKINQKGNDGAIGLGRLVLMWPTPVKSDYAARRPSKGWQGNSDLPSVVWTETGGRENPQMSPAQLNATWVEWLMGWPLGWTDLKPLAMDRSHSVLQQHGSC